MRDVRTDDHGDGVVGLGNDEPETDAVPVRDPLVVLLRDKLMLDDYGGGGGDTHSDGGHARSFGDGKGGGGDGDGNGTPGGNGGHTERGALDLEVRKARVGSGEEDEQADAEPDTNGRSDDLGPEHGLGGSA